MPSPVQAVSSSSGFQFNVCYSIFSCGFSYAEYGQYIFPEVSEPITQASVFPQDFDQEKKTEKPYLVTKARSGGCNLSIPCILDFGCPAFEYNYTNKQTGAMIVSLPQISKEEAARHPEGVIKSTIAERSAHLKVCCCCGPSISLSSKIGFFRAPNPVENQAPPSYQAPQAMIMC